MGFTPTETPPEKKARTEEKQTCLPVTVKMIEEAIAKRTGDDELRFFDKEPGMLVLVGTVEAVTQQTTSVEFTISDGTGRIQVRYYATEAESRAGGIEAGRSISIAGSVRTSPATHFSVLTSRPIKTEDEISYHTTEVAYATLRLQQGDVVVPVVAKALPVMQVSQVAAAPTPARGVAVEGLQSKVLSSLQASAEGRPEGVHLRTLVTNLAPASEAEVRACLMKLVEEGEAFNTIDDDHFGVL
jgi:hypothetical protein